MDECDVVVPRNKIAEFVRFVNTLEKKHEIRIRTFGHAKIPFLNSSLGDVQMKLMMGIKKSFDPRNILNPGKVCGFETKEA